MRVAGAVPFGDGRGRCHPSVAPVALTAIPGDHHRQVRRCFLSASKRRKAPRRTTIEWASAHSWILIIGRRSGGLCSFSTLTPPAPGSVRSARTTYYDGCELTGKPCWSAAEPRASGAPRRDGRRSWGKRGDSRRERCRRHGAGGQTRRQVRFIRTDVTSEADVQRAVDAATGSFGASMAR